MVDNKHAIDKGRQATWRTVISETEWSCFCPLLWYKALAGCCCTSVTRQVCLLVQYSEKMSMCELCALDTVVDFLPIVHKTEKY
ncbi:hypothetical protein E2C01_047455 [Portunus trituberculatus]|uniref:Uncharacterized protein n=1 Tax=Portunus trituberculatus TaxID=210409 RepID=A0A5B7G0G8_PORTR|nr:hypothetical protein [Portunus trituberculatus]